MSAQIAGMTYMSEHETPGDFRRAFVLDDEVRVGTVVCKALTMAGLSAHQFADPLQFLTELKLSPPDLVVLDLALGQTDAVEVIRKLEVLKFKGRVLLISGRHEGALKEIERIGRSHGLVMLEPLQKPFRMAELKSRLETAPTLATAAKTSRQSSANPPAAVTRVDFAEALGKNWLEVWYQPKVDLRSLRICGAEALIRARHPERGVISPVDLLPPAGDPLYRPLSIFVIRQSMMEWERFAERGFPLKLAVNVPASVVNEPGFVDIVRQMIPPDPKFPGLVIEITEDEIIRDPEWVREIATQLRLYNARISLDDFGSAYASLSRLKDLPFSEIKLDTSFVTGCAADALKRGLCQTVVDLAQRFGASSCAEGVETADELRCLTKLGFDTAQGYLFAKPMPAREFLHLLAARQIDPVWPGVSTAGASTPLAARA
jgi:EAL domain-containing protein (putative c-di-GMP-specific phosphodiesterase class I)/FixJ family two-component response regulator